MSILVIAAYHCEVAGEPAGSVDFQVRHFASDSIDEVISRLRNEQPQAYRNADGQEVRWLFDDTVAVEFDPEFKDGAEIIGFITGKPKEITEPDAPPNSCPPSQLRSPSEAQSSDSLRTPSSGGCG
jgi:hypothetical protein